MRWSIVMLVLAACGGESSDEDPRDTAEDTDTDTDPGTTPGADTSAFLDGTVSGPDGVLADANIRFCRGVQCRYATTDAQGAYTFEDVIVAWHSLEIVPPAGSGLATAFAPVELGTDEHRTIDIVIPALDPAHDLGATAELELGSGLLVTLGADDIEPPLFVDPASEAAGVQVPQELWPPVDRPGTVIAAWYTTPFDHHAVSGLPVRFENEWSLPEGSTYEVWVGSYTESQWLDAGTVTVGADGYLTGDAELPLLSTVLLVDAE